MAIRLRESRENLNFSQKQIVDKLGIPVNTIARWERGELRIEHARLLKLAIEHLNCNRRKP